MAQKFIKDLIPTDYEQHEAKTRGIQVIGAGLSRTGTMSLWAALNKLLDGKVYHGAEVFLNGNEHCQFWEGLHNGNSVDFQNML